PFASRRCARRPSSYLAAVWSPIRKPFPTPRSSDLTNLAAPQSTTPLTVCRRTCSFGNRPLRANARSSLLATTNSTLNRPMPLLRSEERRVGNLTRLMSAAALYGLNLLKGLLLRDHD